MVKRFLPFAYLFPALVFFSFPMPAGAEIQWIEGTQNGDLRVPLHFFWSSRCPHCREALPFIESLSRDYPWIRVHNHELTQNRDNVARFLAMAEAMGEDAQSVPAFFVCGRMLTGYDSAEGMGKALLDAARACREAPRAAVAGVEGRDGGTAASPPGEDKAIPVPILGKVAPGDISLPLFTLVIAGLDAFNPCAFFVLLFLLSLMVHARSRVRMLIIGMTFVFFSGLIYFLFMAAWLNLFLVVGGAPVVTLIAGLVALVIGVLNTKDFFAFRQGPSLSISDSAKPGLFRRMRGLLAADKMTTMLTGTVTLALAANSYELLCTAGFPMAYTRVLTINELGVLRYYAYLALYNLIYVLPLLAIVALFTITLGARKLSEGQGRVLKLLSGLMMLGLGMVMLLVPEQLGDYKVAAALLAGAAGTTALVVLWQGRRVAADGA